MIDFFDRLYNCINGQNKLLQKIRFYSGLRFIVRLIANIALPIYLRTTSENKHIVISELKRSEKRIIVSLTSFPARIDRLWLVIETLMRQTYLPDKVILWLSEEQFPGLDVLPKLLLRQQKKGLEIRLCKGDLRSHKKYYYALKEFPGDIVITVDDDVYYNSRLIEYLIDLHNEFPDCICCNRCSEINVKNGQVQPYITWKDTSLIKQPDYRIFFIGMGGVLYPPDKSHPLLFESEVFMKYCFLADDIWINTITRLADVKAVKSAYDSYYLPVMNLHNSELASINVTNSFNDIQLESVRRYCIETVGIEPFHQLIDNYFQTN